jgi:dTDP-glucose 4,6-dehydratase
MTAARRVLISGAAGFLGSHLSERFVREGYEVVGVDNLITGSEANLAGLEGNRAFTLMRQDVSQPFDVQGPLEGVLHLASPASPVDYLELPIETLEVGSLGTRNTLAVARAKGARYLLASTSEVYGDPLVHPQVETYWGNVNPIGVRSVYDEAKRFAEALTMAHHRHYGMDTRIVRIFNTYGPHMRPADGRVVSNFIVQALRGETLSVYGDGSQTRSFCYVEDEVDGIWRLYQSSRHEPTNVGNPNEFTVLELAHLVIEETGSSSTIAYLPLPADDPKVRRPDITIARSVLGWEPKVSLRDGLKRTIPYFQERVASENAQARTLVGP